jgi:hypothetical protein
MKAPRALVLALFVGVIDAGLVPTPNLIREPSDSLSGIKAWAALSAAGLMKR